MLFSAAIFGFFYAWVCSTMWGLDAADPRVAIQAMQAMNASVRNVVFFPAFFLTPLVLAASAMSLWRLRMNSSAAWFAASSVTYLCFGLVLTMAVNVPMNEALALKEVPTNLADARVMWDEYSSPWQFWNVMRTLASGASFLLATLGLLSLTGKTKYTAKNPG
ncbi:DUF1772 domain-containing protein [Paracoccus albus]|uniref:anthrone oxygenase family protein n=1 Tax=Paracoccus albus TaxID=3017784 RepID=UPI0022F0F08D|nr:anthrone oxygenase family protein [Paracoccus albus]WBU59007.1 DUF1772 domain-containing protein [Paracoccus albus]